MFRFFEASKKGLKGGVLLQLKRHRKGSIQKGIERTIVHLCLWTFQLLKHPKRDWKKLKNTLKVMRNYHRWKHPKRDWKKGMNGWRSIQSIISQKHPKRDWKSTPSFRIWCFTNGEASKKGLKVISLKRKSGYSSTNEASKKGLKDNLRIQNII